MASMAVFPAMVGWSDSREGLGLARARTLARPAAQPESTPVLPPPAAVVVEAQEAREPVWHTAGPQGEAARPQASAQALEEQVAMAALAASCLQGHPGAWETLVRGQQRRVYALCFRFTGSASEAEDLTQEVFLKVYRNLRAFDPARASLGVWIAALTRNLLVDHYRRARMERASESLDEGTGEDESGPTRAERLPDPRAGQEQHVAGRELRAQIQAALVQVSPELRAAVILRDLEDMDYREIAEVLGIPQGTVKSRISRGRAELARLLKGLEGQVV